LYQDEDISSTTIIEIRIQYIEQMNL